MAARRITRATRKAGEPRQQYDQARTGQHKKSRWPTSAPNAHGTGAAGTVHPRPATRCVRIPSREWTTGAGLPLDLDQMLRGGGRNRELAFSRLAKIGGQEFAKLRSPRGRDPENRRLENPKHVR